MKIGGIIRDWYEKNKRVLPWRQTSDPYKIWLSEVILQQTQVNQGLDYYTAFASAFPDVFSLASAPEERVLKLWQGLGYYNRARNLHSAARYVVDHLDGEMPRTYDQWLKLKGVGPYTAAAISSICFSEPRAVVDGNVARVISRLYGVKTPVDSSRGSKIIGEFAMDILDKKDPGTHNQAMMEFGSLLCTPLAPGCNRCPLSGACAAFASGQAERYPEKLPKRPKSEVWIRYYIYRCGGETVLQKRENGGIWRSLYQFPAEESNTPWEQTLAEPTRRLSSDQSREGLATAADKSVRRMMGDGHKFAITHISGPVKHQLSHRTIYARFIHVDLENWPVPVPGNWIRISRDRIDDFPVPRLINRYMEVVKF